MTTGNNELILPSDKVLKHVAKLAIEQDKPIMMDYWMDSYGDSPSVLIGVRNNETEEKLLVRSNEEYTSPISKIFKVNQEYIIVTENSIYVVSTQIPTKRIS